jgi:hypothetical protein
VLELDRISMPAGVSAAFVWTIVALHAVISGYGPAIGIFNGLFFAALFLAHVTVLRRSSAAARALVASAELLSTLVGLSIAAGLGCGFFGL